VESTWTPRRQGDLGEVSAMEWLVSAGAIVWVPVVSAPDYDLIAEFGDRLVRVQVKTSTCWRNNRWQVTLATRGGNQSWSGLVKRLDATRFDCLFVHVGEGRRWYIPAAALEASSGLVLGGPKYSGYEVEPGQPLQARPSPAVEAAESGFRR
jgi:PD-(D/E)XK endonuclease